MATGYQHVIDALGGNVVVEPFRGSTGVHGVAVVSGGKYFFVPRREGWDGFVASLMDRDGLVCFDFRRIMDFPVDGRMVRDVRAIYGGDGTLLSVMRSRRPNDPLTAKLAGAEARIQAHVRAAKTAQIEGAPLDRMVPTVFLDEWLRARAIAIDQLHAVAQVSSNEVGWMYGDYERRYEFIRALHRIELAGIKIYLPALDAAIEAAEDQAERHCLRSMKQNERGGYVHTLYNPMGGKTGRTRVQGGFNSQAIPKSGRCRRFIVSRFPSGKIASFDFNAIDYRCIVASIGGEFARLYDDADDFHMRTLELLFPVLPGYKPFELYSQQRRDLIKAISYVYIYGGSEETLSAKTGLPLGTIRELTKRMDETIGPIKEFRSRLREEAHSGSIHLPTGQSIGTTEHDGSLMHEGKLIGLYAQTYSSYIFEAAVAAVDRLIKGRPSRVIMLVHDELVVDLHPDDERDGLPAEIKSVMEAVGMGGHRVRWKMGTSYGELG